ncbi:MAG: altronate dehydratase [Clostridiales bacterium]|nr:altronate dehydratase [Clostridiales bacterium]
MEKSIKIYPQDLVAVAITELNKGDRITVSGKELLIQEKIPSGHKIALQEMNEGEKVIKYGFPIGIATKTIFPGSWVHTHNLKTLLAEKPIYTYTPDPVPVVSSRKGSFYGFERENGKVGIRNFIWIIPTVGCVNAVAKAIAHKAKTLLAGSVENIIAFSHPYGCSQMGEDQENTRKILGKLTEHPNAAGVLLVGLGCENSGVHEIQKYIKYPNSKRIEYMVAQEHEDEIQVGLEKVGKLIEQASSDQRTEQDLSKLIVGLKCGGSDGFSGITANPVIGKFSDVLLSYGGSSILTEVPEMFGAETILMDRARDEEAFGKIVKLIEDFKYYYESHNLPIYENPSPGNKAGGISTLEDKSLGCTQKAGTGVVEDVLSYGEGLESKGLNLLSSPGNDLVASTALAASGAQLVLFSTGRGTPFASPVPTVKISSNSFLAEKKKNWIDFDAGKVLTGKTISDTGEELFEKVLDYAQGEYTKSEKDDYHDMAIFRTGVTL